jgi:hypothetical protein
MPTPWTWPWPRACPSWPARAAPDRAPGRAPGAHLLPADSPTEAWNQALLQAAPWPAGRGRGRALVRSGHPAALRQAYADKLLQPLAGPAAHARAPAARGRRLARRRPAGVDLPLRDLYDYGVLCGHRQAREVLRASAWTRSRPSRPCCGAPARPPAGPGSRCWGLPR